MGRSLRSARAWIVCSLAVMGTLALQHGADAALFPNLYQVTVISEDGVRYSRDEAIRIAMAQLLVRVTGRREAAYDPTLAPLLERPENYVSSYGSDLQGRPLVGFAPSRIEAALTELNWPVWPPERPLTLLWVAVDDGLGERAMLGANESAAASPGVAALTAALREEAEMLRLERGLPLAFPLLDLEDMALVSVVDVWGFFEDAIQRASARYRADAVLLARVRPGLFGTEVQCLHLYNGVRRSASGMSLRECLDTVGDVYAAEFSVVGGASVTRLTVLDVGSLGDYGRVVSYLEGLSVLQTVDVESLENGVLTLRVGARGDPQVLERVFTLGGVLRPADRIGFGAPTGLVFTVARPDQPR